MKNSIFLQVGTLVVATENTCPENTVFKVHRQQNHCIVRHNLSCANIIYLIVLLCACPCQVANALTTAYSLSCSLYCPFSA